MPRSRICTRLWDRCVRESGNTGIYAMSWYLDLVSEEWCGLVWPSETCYRAVLPLPVIRKWGIKVVQQPFFCQYLGLFTTLAPPPGLLQAFISAIPEHFAYVSAYCFHPSNTPWLEEILPGFPNLSRVVRYTQQLFLGVPYTELSKGYTPDLRRNLRRAEDTGWHVYKSRSVAPLLALFREHHSQAIPGGVAPRAYRLFETLALRLLSEKRLQIRYASDCHGIHAGIALLTDPVLGDTYIFNAADPAGRKGNARALLLDRHFRKQAGTPVRFDFESPEAASVRDYYRKFGAADVPYYAVRYNGLPTPFRELQALRLRLLGIEHP